MNIRPAKSTDQAEWLRMRSSLWAGANDAHEKDISRYFSGESRDILAVFVLEREEGRLGGFIELNMRNYAEGSSAPQVPYLEAWYIDCDLRNSGLGRQLIERAEDWAKEQGCYELASDTELGNAESIAAHKALGFEETERIVCFLRKLGAPALLPPFGNEPDS